MQQYYIISTKHTHKRDRWFTFWRPDSKGYTFYKSDAGVYEPPPTLDIEKEKQMGAVYADKHLVDTLSASIKYEGKDRLILQNTPMIRALFKIDHRECKAPHPYKF